MMTKFHSGIEEVLNPLEKLRRHADHINAIPRALAMVRSQLVPPIEQLLQALQRRPYEHLNPMSSMLALATRQSLSELD